MKAPSGLMIESALADFHALRQGFSPPAPSSITTLSSYDYLSRVFNRELNISPWDYLNRYRVLQSKQLLLNTAESVGAIARQVGFKDQAYFSRVFHKVTGMSPQGFRETPTD